jgi:hypothetical protein
MENKIKKYIDFIKEGVAEPMVKPATPRTKPVTKPNRPSPIPIKRPSVIPKPKAELNEVVNKFLELTKGNDEINMLLKNKYKK